MVAEQIHRYPRWITWALDLLSFLAVGAALLLFSRDLMALLWRSYGIDTTLMARVPYLPEIVQAITQGAAHLCIVDPAPGLLAAREGFLADALASHPPIRQRVARLQGMGYLGEVPAHQA